MESVRQDSMETTGHGAMIVARCFPQAVTGLRPMKKSG